MKNLVYYISGHGYGHATRSIEVMKALLARDEELFLHVRTNAPRWLFELNLPRDRYSFHTLQIDIGAVQNTSMFIEKQATYDAVRSLFEQSGPVLENERRFLKGVDAGLIVGDIPPLAFEIAAHAGLPSLAITNFSWDWIYNPYVTAIPEYSELINRIRMAYSKADLLLRLPMYGDLSAFSVIRDIPLIARKAKQSRTVVRKKLDLDATGAQPLVLIALRPVDSFGLDVSALGRLNDFVFVTFGLSNVPANFINLPPDFMSFPELVNACDVAVSKPGYGIVSEIIANRTPMLYIARDDFVEYDILVEGLQKFSISELLPRESFLTGRWLSYLEHLVDRDNDWPEVRVDGADAAASEILTFL